MEEAAFREADVVVLGGGPAGSTCASALAACGFSVILAERANLHERCETSLAGMHAEFARATRAKCWPPLSLGPLGKSLLHATFRLCGASFVQAMRWGAPFIPEK